ncbi:hypothetical protein BJY04DRAFT_229983 [Aspergillus karnatakaensis]|uniref:uncharacterized protein n=1 Tax=Aspergillus karnatakaensis TaxID=1810916 RepID=UPI003CCD9E75
MLLNSRTLAVALGLVGRSYAQGQSWRNQVNVSMCNWGEVRATTLRDTVYLDGGSLWWQLGYSDGSVSYDSRDNLEGLLYSFNLSSSFTTDTNQTALFNTLPKAGGVGGNIAPTYHDGALLSNDNKLYLYGGLIRPSSTLDPPPPDSVLAYERYQYGPHSDLWQPQFINTDTDNVTRYVTNGAGVSAPSENLAFYISGMRAPNWGPIFDNSSATSLSQNMIKLDMAEMRDPVWTNTSLPDYVPARANAEAVWVPVSEKGVVVLIGGVLHPETIYAGGLSDDEEAESERVSPVYMRTVSVYDVAGNQWYNQNTTGDVPPQLTQFCSVYASAEDGSSHNIYIYGGYDGLSPLNRPSDDVYVLSLPSFEWIHLYEGDSRVNGRKEHKCVKPYPDQMLVLGGLNLDTVTCIDLVRVFNLNTGRFQEAYNPVDWNDYEVPSLVSGRIGGDTTGGATKTAPSAWTTPSLSSIFESPYTKTIATYYPYNTPATNATSTSIPTSGGGSSFPAWAGALIGVLLALLLLAGLLIWWFMRRRRKQNPRRQSEVSAGRGSRVMQWVNAGAFSPPGPKDPENSTIVSGGFGADSTVAPSVTTAGPVSGTAASRTTAEAGSEPVYEMHGHSVTHAVELPTSFNHETERERERDGAMSTPSTATSPFIGYASPVSPEIPLEKPPVEKEGSTPSRPTHVRNVSSLSSVHSFDENGQAIQRPRYQSGVSEASISSAGTRFVETGLTSTGNRGSGLEDIPDTEDGTGTGSGTGTR